MKISVPSKSNASPDEAVLFADVSGSTALYERIGDTEASELINQLFKSMQAIAERFGGRLIKTIGDELMLWFPSSTTAVKCAIEMQLSLESKNTETAEILLGLKIGFCSGPMQHRDGDVFGDTVNTAARLTSLARRGSITTDQKTYISCADLQLNMRAIGSHSLSGKAAPTECVEILWSNAELTAAEVARPRRSIKRQLVAYYKGKEYRVGHGDSITMGRSSACEIVIENAKASSVHGKIFGSVENFELSDTSANGTTVCIDGQSAIVIHREDIILMGTGKIHIGMNAPSDSADPVDFKIVEIN